MANLSKIKRGQMLEFLDQLKKMHKDDDKALIALNEIQTKLTEKRYGLVWEEHDENVDIQMQTKIPVFVEQPKLEIQSDAAKPYNFLLEGDNLHSLYLLEKTHKNKIDVIYIDPPYNTGNKDFIYDDKMVSNEDGFKHSKWLSFMFKRLIIAKKLLSNKGIIFISIDDNECSQLKILCDNIFGEKNFIGNFIWQKTSNPNSTANNLGVIHEYVICYSLKPIVLAKQKYDNKEIDQYKYSDEFQKIKGNFKLVGLNKTGTVNDLRPNLMYKIKAPDGTIINPKPRWRWSKEKFEQGLKEKRIVFNKKGNKWTVYYKQYLLEDNNGNKIDRGSLIKSILTDCGRTVDGNNTLKQILNSTVFDFPKPVELIKKLLSFITNNRSLILDFFAGSGTTGQAVMELNQEDGGNRQFILCTNNENNICSNVTLPRLKTVITGQRPDKSKYSDGLKANLMYYKTDFVKKTSENLSNDLMNHIKEMIQLENGHKIDNERYLMILDDEQMDKLETNWKKFKHVECVYISSEVALSSKQDKMLSNVEIKTIPDYYFDFELKEAGEIW